MTLNRYIYARDNPERYTDPNGHMFVAETDSGQEIGGDYLYRPAVVETVTVTNSGSERKRSEYQVTDTPAMTTYQNTALSGNNPYGGGLNSIEWASPTIRIESSTSTYPFTNQCGVQPCQPATGTRAQAITVAVTLGVGSLLVGIATSPLLATPLSVPTQILDYSMYEGEQGVGQYLIDSGSSAKPGGVLEAYAAGAENGPIDYFTGLIQGLEGIF